MNSAFDRSTEDIGNIVHLEHVNLTIPDQLVATRFYISTLGLTRDPYMMTGTDNMWVNAGRTQFHLPHGKPQRFRGTITLVMPDREGLLTRLRNGAALLAGTEFAFEEQARVVAVRCPWGNRLRCVAPDRERFGDVVLGIAELEFVVPEGAAAGIAAFYRDVLGADTAVAGDDDMRCARMRVGDGQTLAFRETRDAPEVYDGHHIQIYVSDFSGPYRRLLDLGLVCEESSQHQYRFVDIVDPATRAPLFRIEHEVRSLTHPLCARPLVNRNPRQNNRDYVRGRDAFVPPEQQKA